MKRPQISSRFSTVAAFVLLALAAPARAQVYEMSFTDTNAATKIVGPDLTWYNPNGTVIVTAISGLDRKVKMELIKAGVVVQTQTSAVITVANRIKASDNNEFYGTKFNLTKPADGNYILRSTVLDINGVQASVNNYNITIDTVKPTSTAITNDITGYNRVTTGAEWLLGNGGSDYPDFSIGSVSDNTGVDDGAFVVYRGDGSVYKRVNLSLNVATNEFTYPVRSTFPSSNLDEVFKIGFEITDKAGNVYKTPLQKVRWDTISNAPTAPFGIYNPASGNTLGPGLAKFDAYTPGMAVTTNPIRLAYRVPKSNYIDYAQSGIWLTNSVGETTKVGEDATYVYLTLTAPFGLTNGNYLRWVNFANWSGGAIAYDLVLAPSAPKTPDMQDVQYLYSDIGWSTWKRYWVKNTSLPVTISSIKVTAAARTYPQTVNHRGTCTIPTGGTSCTIAANTTLAKGTTGYIHDSVNIYNADSSLQSDPDWAEVHWNDQHYPSITQSYDASTRLLKLMINQPGRGAYFDRLRLDDVWLESGGVKLPVTGTKIAETGPNYTYLFDLNQLAQGNYTLVAVAQELHGPKTSLSLFSLYSDKTKPTIQFKHQGGTVPSVIENIKNLRMLVADSYDAAPVVSRLTVSGGPINDALDLGYSKLSDGWAPEVPRMFPTLETGQEYTVTATAKDAQGNTATATQIISINPQNLVRHDGINVLPVAQSLLDINDKPLGQIAFKGALTEGGSQSRGPQAGFFTLRRDAQFSVMFNGTRVNPGETKDVVIPLDGAGLVKLPVWPADAGVVGKATYMLDIPQLTAN